MAYTIKFVFDGIDTLLDDVLATAKKEKWTGVAGIKEWAKETYNAVLRTGRYDNWTSIKFNNKEDYDNFVKKFNVRRQREKRMIRYETEDGEARFAPVAPGTHIMTVSEWIKEVNDGMFIPDDGEGYWMMGETQESDVGVFSPQPVWATHVAWFNK